MMGSAGLGETPGQVQLGRGTAVQITNRIQVVQFQPHLSLAPTPCPVMKSGIDGQPPGTCRVREGLSSLRDGTVSCKLNPGRPHSAPGRSTGAHAGSFQLHGRATRCCRPGRSRRIAGGVERHYIIQSQNVRLSATTLVCVLISLKAQTMTSSYRFKSSCTLALMSTFATNMVQE